MSKKTKKVEKVLSEQLLRDKSKKQMQDLHKTISKSGGDIGEQVRKSEKTKEDKMPNSIYMDNPFGQSKRKIETYEDFCKSARKAYESVNTSVLERFRIGDRVKIADGSGLSSNKKGIIVPPKEVKTNGRGVPTNVEGAYKPVDWNREVAIKLDDGELITMFKNRVILESKKDNKKMEGEDPCWDGYEMVGTKEKDGKEVPNCVPKDKSKKDKKTDDLKESVISTFEGFLPKHLEDMYFWRDRDGISLNDDNWVKGTFDDFLRPMFKNLPNHKDRHPYDVLRSGKFIETKDGKVVGQIDTMRGHMVTLDVIDENNEHQYIDFELNKLIKKIKDNQLQVNSNEKSKDKKVDTPWGKIVVKENE